MRTTPRYPTVALLGAAMVLGAGRAEPQEPPSFDCAAASSGAEELVCSDPELARLDVRLAERFAAALEVARGLDAGAAEAERDLRARQRGWISGRDECWKAPDLRACVETAYLRREGELVATFLLQEPTQIAWWTCGEMPANQVITYFFDTALPSVRIEHGDTVDAGSLTPTASGARYDASFGRYVWIHGTEAMYRTADPEGQVYDCVLAAEPEPL